MTDFSWLERSPEEVADELAVKAASLKQAAWPDLGAIGGNISSGLSQLGQSIRDRVPQNARVPLAAIGGGAALGAGIGGAAYGLSPRDPADELEDPASLRQRQRRRLLNALALGTLGGAAAGAGGYALLSPQGANLQEAFKPGPAGAPKAPNPIDVMADQAGVSRAAARVAASKVPQPEMPTTTGVLGKQLINAANDPVMTGLRHAGRAISSPFRAAWNVIRPQKPEDRDNAMLSLLPMAPTAVGDAARLARAAKSTMLRPEQAVGVNPELFKQKLEAAPIQAEGSKAPRGGAPAPSAAGTFASNQKAFKDIAGLVGGNDALGNAMQSAKELVRRGQGDVMVQLPTGSAMPAKALVGAMVEQKLPPDLFRGYSRTQGAVQGPSLPHQGAGPWPRAESATPSRWRLAARGLNSLGSGPLTPAGVGIRGMTYFGLPYLTEKAIGTANLANAQRNDAAEAYAAAVRQAVQNLAQQQGR
jgi:hypothetical protein